MKNLLVSAAMALLLPVANAVNLPQMKEGLWSIHSQTTTNPGSKKSEATYTLCRDHAYDQSVQALANNVKGCSKLSESFQGGRYYADIHCTVGGTAIESKATATFQGDTSAHSETHGTYTPALAGMSEMTIIMDQKYTGSCPAGAVPGDRTNPDGTVIHLGKH